MKLILLLVIDCVYGSTTTHTALVDRNPATYSIGDQIVGRETPDTPVIWIIEKNPRHVKNNYNRGYVLPLMPTQENFSDAVSLGSRNASLKKGRLDYDRFPDGTDEHQLILENDFNSPTDQKKTTVTTEADASQSQTSFENFLPQPSSLKLPVSDLLENIQASSSATYKGEPFARKWFHKESRSSSIPYETANYPSKIPYQRMFSLRSGLSSLKKDRYVDFTPMFIIDVPSRCLPGYQLDGQGSCKEIFPFQPSDYSKISDYITPVKQSDSKPNYTLIWKPTQGTDSTELLLTDTFIKPVEHPSEEVEVDAMPIGSNETTPEQEVDSASNSSTSNFTTKSSNPDVSHLNPTWSSKLQNVTSESGLTIHADNDTIAPLIRQNQWLNI